MALIDMDLFAEQMIVLDWLLKSGQVSGQPELGVVAFTAKGLPSIPLVRDALEGLRNLGDEIQEQIFDHGTILLEGDPLSAIRYNSSGEAICWKCGERLRGNIEFSPVNVLLYKADEPGTWDYDAEMEDTYLASIECPGCGWFVDLEEEK